jgi:superfamily II DNA or RNA helicase
MVSTYLRASVSKQARLEGQAMLDRVELRQGDASVAKAGVMGFEVTLHNRAGTVWAVCQCAEAADGEVCAHAWAVVLACDPLGHLAGNGHGDSPYYIDVVDEDDLGRGGYTRRYRYPTPLKVDPHPWKRALAPIRPALGYSYERGREFQWPPNRQAIYFLSTHIGSTEVYLKLSPAIRDMRKDGAWGTVRPLNVQFRDLEQVPEPDRGILASLIGSPTWNPSVSESFALRGPGAMQLLARLCATERIFGEERRGSLEGAPPIQMDESLEPWTFKVVVEYADPVYRVKGFLLRDGQREQVVRSTIVTNEGLLLSNGRIGRVSVGDHWEWINALRAAAVEVPASQGAELVKELVTRASLPPIEWPPELHFTEECPEPVVRFTVAEESINYRSQKRLYGALSFDYAGQVFSAHSPSPGTLIPSERRFVRRSRAAESAATDVLNTELGLRTAQVYHDNPGVRWEVPRGKLAAVVRTLAGHKWRVQADGKLFRQPKAFKGDFSSSGIDWFELRGGIQFEGQFVSFPALLKAIQRGDNTILLADGSLGFVPEDFVKKYEALLDLGTTEGDAIRFKRNQAGVLDALLAERPEIPVGEVFAQARERLREFDGIQAAPQPEGFVGELRGYQLEGLGWMHFLQKMAFGGCLADDMGVGKTPQVLAALEERRCLRERGEPIPPSLAVLPRSLVYNWIREAARFTPKLRVLDHSRTDRDKSMASIQDHDLVITTYGTLRRDAADFRNVEFDYVILDEAQAIKNAESESAKAARLLNGRHKLVMSGTPIENHLGELWSLFEFLNPGMLGGGAFRSASTLRNPDQETRQVLSKALRPFILRRTKEQVARELPPKIEQTVYCEMDAVQRRIYDEVRDYYRASLLKRVERDGMGKAKIEILEALLRLRQVACHPGLVDKAHEASSSAKLDVLLEQVVQVAEEGHKALVFSQFTSFLALAGKRLAAANLTYEYLDGKTRDREARVNRFQTDAACPLFLISLKAGGVGLNLTAADYVFILDPWWNPAVEAQAIDRAHRIGQDKQVFSYRLIARGTVEEKVLDLQSAKRELAASIIDAESESVIGALKREDLEMLLS